MLKTTTASPAEEPGDIRKFRAISAQEKFEPQISHRTELPDPEVFLRNLTQRAVEILAGSRDLSQIARWVTDDVFHSMQQQVAARTVRTSLLAPTARPRLARRFEVTTVRTKEPRAGIIEGCVLVTAGRQVRVAAVRLEGLDRRWRASSFTLL